MIHLHVSSYYRFFLTNWSSIFLWMFRKTFIFRHINGNKYRSNLKHKKSVWPVVYPVFDNSTLIWSTNQYNWNYLFVHLTCLVIDLILPYLLLTGIAFLHDWMLSCPQGFKIAIHKQHHPANIGISAQPNITVTEINAFQWRIRRDG